MRARLRDESGVALIVALMLLGISLLIGFALIARSDNQTRQSAQERTKESSFDLGEAAMNAEALQLSRSWPSAAPTPPFDNTCTPSATSTTCPQATAISGGYTTQDYAQACPGSSSTPLWQTTIHDDGALGSGTTTQYWSTAVDSYPNYDANGNGIVWLRSTANAQCNKVSMVSLVSRSVVPMDFPAGVITANSFSTSNQGRKVIVDTLGAYAQPPSIRPTSAAAQPSPIVVRCSGMTQAQCLNYQSTKGQVQPPATQISSSSSSSALSLSQLQSLEQQATAAGTFFNGTCPANAAALASVGGAPVVIKGPCPDATGNMSFTGNTVINSSANPGVLVVENGTISFGGTIVFYGLIYGVNKQGCSCNVVTITGNAAVQGAIAVDGLGGVLAGASKTNVIFDPRAPTLLRGASGAAINKNTFRVLPSSTP